MLSPSKNSRSISIPFPMGCPRVRCKLNDAWSGALSQGFTVIDYFLEDIFVLILRHFTLIILLVQNHFIFI
jgi:hypothetical protein